MGVAFKRVVRRRAGAGLGLGHAGDAFQGVQVGVGDVAVVDDLLGEGHEIGRVADLGANGAGLGEGDQVLVEAQADEPENLVLHGGPAWPAQAVW